MSSNKKWLLLLFFFIGISQGVSEPVRLNFFSFEQCANFPGKDLIGHHQHNNQLLFWTTSKVLRFNGWQFIEDKAFTEILWKEKLIPLSCLYYNSKGELLFLGNNKQFNSVNKDVKSIPLLNSISAWASLKLGTGILITGMRKCAYVSEDGKATVLSNWRGNIIYDELDPAHAYIFSDTVRCINQFGKVVWSRLRRGNSFRFSSLSYSKSNDNTVDHFFFCGKPINSNYKQQEQQGKKDQTSSNFKDNSFLFTVVRKDRSLISYGWYMGFIANALPDLFQLEFPNHDFRGIYRDEKRSVVSCSVDRLFYYPNYDSVKLACDESMIASVGVSTPYGVYQFMNPGNIFLKKDGKFKELPDRKVCCFSCSYVNDTILLCGGFDFYLLNIKTKKVTFLPGFEDDSYIWAVKKWNGKYYITNEDGLYVYDLQAKRLKKIFTGRCRDLAVSTDRIYVATLDKGVVGFDSQNKLRIQFDEENGIAPNCVFSLAFAKDPRYLFLGSKGEFRVINLKTLKQYVFTKHEGMLLSEFNSGSSFYDVQKNEFWMGGVDGIIRFDPDKITAFVDDSLSFSPTFFSLITTDKRKNVDVNFLLGKRIEVDPDQRQLNFYIGSSRLGRYPKEEIQLWFSISDNFWTINDKGDNTIRLMNLPNGDYKVRVKFLLPNGKFSEENVIDLEILPYWYQSMWFYSSLFLLIGVVSFVLTRLYFLNKNRQVRSTVRNLQSELLILRSQINPHFLNNLFDLIAFQAIKRDIGGVINTIQQVSAFFKSVLNMSSVAIHDLEKEIEWLENYLSLQKLVLSTGLEYEILIDENLDLTGIKVPALLIQPIIENSIKHGFLQGSINGKLDVVLTAEADFALLSISDNGEGKTNIHAISTKVGLKNVENRIAVFSKLTNQRIDVFYGSTAAGGYQTNFKFYYHD